MVCCIIIISIMSNVALPAISNFRSSEKVKSEASILVSYIRQAKYQAMQENRVNRIIFAPEDPNFFKVQVCTKQTEDDQSFNELIQSRHSDLYDNDSNWESIADEGEVELNPSVEVILPDKLKVNADYGGKIYFAPDGYLYVVDKNDSNSVSSDKIPEIKIDFKYGSAALVVCLNAMGVVSSQAFAENDGSIDAEEIEW